MPTIVNLAERLDMSAEDALEKLRYMLFDVPSVDTELSDEQCDLLIDVDDDPAVAERVRKTKLKEQEKAEKRNERLREAAKKAAAKRKATSATAKKAAAKKTATKKTAVADEETVADEGAPEIVSTDQEPALDTSVEEAASPVAVILPRKTEEEKAAEAAAEVSAEAAEPVHKAEVVTSEEVKAAEAKKKAEKEKKKKEESDIKIGRAIEREAETIQILRADGTKVEAPEVEASETGAGAVSVEEEEEERGVLAEAERQQEEAEAKTIKQAVRSHVKPDPAVVAEVQRRAAERARKAREERELREGREKREVVKTPVKQASTGKTARKRQKKAEKLRAEEAKRRDAAAAVRGLQAAGPTGQAKRRRYKRHDEDGLGAAVDDALTKRVLEVEESMTVEELAEAIDVGVNELILELMEHDILAHKNEALNLDVIRMLAEPEGFEVRSAIPEEDEVLAEEPDEPGDLLTRAPVVTVMGHVDHGKTTLLDHVRAANVAAGEAGGITQHIAAYDVKIGKGRVVFLDTPGHAAFTQMRARGAQATDIVVLVVAADDGVMPQTVEAIDHARAAEVPIVVAVNKCDKADAQPDRIRQELVKYELVDEQWGGKTIIKNISAINGEGVDELMEHLLLEAELLELKANPKKRARGAVVESEISRGQGPVAWILVQNGTLRVGDVFLAGEAYGRVRAMVNSRGESVEEVGPATPVLVMGFNGVPDAGDHFVVLEEERVARAIAEKRAHLAKLKQGQGARRITLEDFHARMLAGERQTLNVVLKADVQGSVDVLKSSLAKIGNEEVHVQFVHTGVGGINESDVVLAGASDAVIIGFHVVANSRVTKLAEQEGVDIRTFQIIYEVNDAVHKALEGMLEPEKKENIKGHAEIREVFRSSSLGNICGCHVQDGEITRHMLARVLRDDVVVYSGKIASLKRQKDDVKTVATGYECGIMLENFQDVKTGDIIEVYEIEKVAKTLA